MIDYSRLCLVMSVSTTRSNEEGTDTTKDDEQVQLKLNQTIILC